MSDLSRTDKTIELDVKRRIDVRVYRDAAIAKPHSLVLHLHGGSFLGGSFDTGSKVATKMAEIGAVVIAADYPATPFPTSFYLCYQLLLHIAKHRSSWGMRGAGLFVAGDEAGANLAAGLALMARDQGEPELAGQILISPMLDPCLSTASLREAQIGDANCAFAQGWKRYLGEVGASLHPYSAPSQSMRLVNLAPAFVVTAEDDPLRDEALAYAAKLRGAGVPTEEHIVAKPTGWPDALFDPNASDPPGCAAATKALSRFLAEHSAAGVKAMHSHLAY